MSMFLLLIGIILISIGFAGTGVVSIIICFLGGLSIGAGYAFASRGR